MFAFGVTIFAGAFLLFLVQPLIGKFILPWFGGSPSVWTTCLLFFQTLLLGGYAYAHLSIRCLKPRPQVLLHLGLLVIALLLLPIAPGQHWKPPDSDMPTLRILLLLTVCLGLPYGVLAATGPLMQAWFSQTQPSRSPYRLYALSNIGSLLALVSYPFFIGPNFSRQAQAIGWSGGLVVFALLAGWCGHIVWKRAQQVALPSEMAAAELRTARRGETRWLWFVLPMCGSVLLLAVTNQICQDIAVVPFLWVMPLSLYLLSFIISFGRERWYGRPLWMTAYVVTVGIILWVMLGMSFVEPSHPWLQPLAWLLKKGRAVTMFPQIGIYLAALFFGCMICHGELHRLRPPSGELTRFYLMVAAGGASGGVFVAVIAPLIFKRYFELHTGLFATAALAVVVLFVDVRTVLRQGWRRWVWSVLLLAVMGIGWGFILDVRASRWYAVELSRNFYGVLKVSEYNRNDPEQHKYVLWHGGTQHGFQFLSDEKRLLPTTYYSNQSGIGRLMLNYPRTNGLRVGGVGLGIGTLITYGQHEDYFRIYEINEEVLRLARTRFTYLRDSPATVDIVLGDARLSLEREPSQQFDILTLDAFNSDAVPVHLLTREAFEIYDRHLKPAGVIAVNISNWHLDLRPVVVRVAEHFGFGVAIIDTRTLPLDWDLERQLGAYSSTWVLLTRNTDFLEHDSIASAASLPAAGLPVIKMWTDDESNLFQILILPNRLRKVLDWFRPHTNVENRKDRQILIEKNPE